MRDIFITANTLWNHHRLLDLNRTQFSSIAERNETLVERWNVRVDKGDRVYHLGDAALGRPEDAIGILNRLNGQIHQIRGNHE